MTRFKGAQVTGTDDEDEAVLPKKSTSPSKSTSKAVKVGKGPVQRGEFGGPKYFLMK